MNLQKQNVIEKKLYLNWPLYVTLILDKLEYIKAISNLFCLYPITPSLTLSFLMGNKFQLCSLFYFFVLIQLNFARSYPKNPAFQMSLHFCKSNWITYNELRNFHFSQEKKTCRPITLMYFNLHNCRIIFSDYMKSHIYF